MVCSPMPGTMKKTPFGLPLGGSHSRVYSHSPVDADGKYCGKSSVSGRRAFVVR